MPFWYYIHIKPFESTGRGFLIILTFEKERKWIINVINFFSPPDSGKIIVSCSLKI